MANSDKNIIITPNRNLSGQPEISFIGFGNSAIFARASDDALGTLSFETNGQKIFSVDTNISSGKIFDVVDNDSVSRLSIFADGSSVINSEESVDILGDGVVLPSYETHSLPPGEEGLIVYDKTEKTVKFHNGKTWVDSSLVDVPIVTDGLITYLDPKTYVYGSNTLVDISGYGNNGTLVNGAFYRNVNGGVIVLDGSDDYIDVPTPNMSASNYTVMGAARYITVSGRTFSGRTNNWLMGHWGGGTQNYYAEGWVSGVGAGPSDHQWRIYASTGNIGADSYAFYVNGVLNSGPNANGSQGPNGLSIGRYAPGGSEYTNGEIGFLLIYNRVLTQAEILQNYLAFRQRYGI